MYPVGCYACSETAVSAFGYVVYFSPHLTVEPILVVCQVKNHLWLFVNCLIENPTFDSQTKENMTLQPKGFGSKAALSDKFITQVCCLGRT